MSADSRRAFKVDIDFTLANGTFIYLGTVETGTNNSTCATPFYNTTCTLTFATVIENNALLVTILDGTGSYTLTAKDTVANEYQWDADAGTDTQDAAAFVTMWNAHSILSKYATATSALAVVTLTSKACCPLMTITQSSGSTVTIARGANFGRTLAGRTLLVQASGDTRVAFGKTASLSASATNDLLLADGDSRVVLTRYDYGYIASNGGSVKVFELL